MKTLIKSLLVSFAICCLPTTGYSTVQVFLKLDGINGDSVDPSHTNEIDVLTFKIGMQQRGLALAGGAASAAKSDFLPLSVFKAIDKSSPALFVACASGQHIPTATLVIRDTNRPSPQEYFKIELTDVLVSSLNENGDATDSNGTLVETVSLSFTKLQWTFFPTQASGQQTVHGGFDLKGNKKL
ncbi:MAG: type secretion system secreted protein Hcp [Chthoniobacter sp.]|jgi:type VI secretion system secreted protein Hcp|nr:type secretion system secreted protein Hcp [Chthoniobacter sp.]